LEIAPRFPLFHPPGGWREFKPKPDRSRATKSGPFHFHLLTTLDLSPIVDDGYKVHKKKASLAEGVTRIGLVENDLLYVKQ
jgi:hypothetical protein